MRVALLWIWSCFGAAGTAVVGHTDTEATGLTFGTFTALRHPQRKKAPEPSGALLKNARPRLSQYEQYGALSHLRDPAEV